MPKKDPNEELMPVAWHPNRWWAWCIFEDDKKEIERIFESIEIFVTLEIVQSSL